MDSITITTPEVTAVNITPNPCEFNQSIAVSVTVTEISVTRYGDYYGAGEFYGGEM